MKISAQEIVSDLSLDIDSALASLRELMEHDGISDGSKVLVDAMGGRIADAQKRLRQLCEREGLDPNAE